MVVHKIVKKSHNKIIEMNNLDDSHLHKLLRRKRRSFEIVFILVLGFKKS